MATPKNLIGSGIVVVATAIGGVMYSSSMRPLGGATGGTAATGGSTGSGGATLGSGGKYPTGGVTAAGGTTSTGSGGTAGATTACPGHGGPTMIRVPMGYCIDSTEVTQAQYQAWLNTNPPTSGQITDCSWNTSYIPTNEFTPLVTPNVPVMYINWCDAYAYCAAVGKRLCGKIGGGSNAYADWNNASASQWYAACSMNGTRTYPYGNVYNPNACNGSDSNHGAPIDVRNMSSCQSYVGLFDMSGNVGEWEDSCEGHARWSYCRIRGGCFCPRFTGLHLTCGMAEYGSNRDSNDKRFGFRCCS